VRCAASDRLGSELTFAAQGTNDGFGPGATASWLLPVVWGPAPPHDRLEAVNFMLHIE